MKTKMQVNRKLSLGSMLAAALALSTALPAQLRAQSDPGSIIVPVATITYESPEGLLGAWTVGGSSLRSASYLTPSATGDANWRVVGAGDFDADGNSDYVFEHADGTLAVWFMKGTTMVQAALLAPSNTGDPLFRVRAVADFNRDGKPDLLFQHDDGTLVAWIMEGISMAQASLLQPSQTGVRDWRVVAAADIDQEGQTDLLFQHRDGTLGIWYMNGLTLDTPTVSYPVEAGWRAAGLKDLDGDGNPDIVFQHNSGTVGAWFMGTPIYQSTVNADGTPGPFIKKSPALLSTTLLNPSEPGGGLRVVAVSGLQRDIGPASSSSSGGVNK
jgi:hypothetical protein